MRKFSLIIFAFAVSAANLWATENLSGAPNAGKEGENAEVPSYQIKDKIDEAVLGQALKALESLKKPNEKQFGPAVDAALREKIAEADTKMAGSYAEMLKNCSDFVSYQGGLVVMMKVSLYVSVLLLMYKAAASFYTGDMAGALATLIGIILLFATACFLSELLPIISGFV